MSHDVSCSSSLTIMLDVRRWVCVQLLCSLRSPQSCMVGVCTSGEADKKLDEEQTSCTSQRCR